MSEIHAVKPFGAPVLYLDEQIVRVPPTGVRVNNRARKLLFFLEANCRHRVENWRDFDFELSAGDILILPHECQQLYLPRDAQTTRVHALRMVLDPALVPPLKSAWVPAIEAPNAPETVESWAARAFARPQFLRGGLSAEMRETLARMRRESEGEPNQVARRLRVGAACLDLMALLARHIEGRSPQNLPAIQAGAFHSEQARDFITKHLETPLSLSEIAAHLGISPEHLARLWKEKTGTTVFEYVRRCRIERAKSLLSASDLNISQIARACGFSSLALFSRTFKAQVGVAPGQYRENLVG